MEAGGLAFAFTFAVSAMPFALIGSALFQTCFGCLADKRAFGSAFIEGVFAILAVCAVPEMLGVNASRVVAGMTNEPALRNWTFEFLKNEPVSEVISPLAIFSPGDLPVTLRSSLTSVIPAARFKIDFDPKEDPLPW